MNEHYLTIGIIYLLIAATSIISYDGVENKPENSNRQKQKESVSSFKYFYRLSQITCLSVFGLFFAGFADYTLSLFHNLSALYVGASISIIGAVVFSAAKLNLGKQYSHCSNMYLPKDIVTNGVYKYIRHPIYTANLLIVFGLFISTGSILVFGVWFGMTVYYQRSAKIEEKYLEITFKNYKNYKQTTGRFLPRKTTA